MENNLSTLEKFFINDFWPDCFFINHYPVLAIFWNLILLAVPFLLALYFKKCWEKNKFNNLFLKIKALIIFVIWLLFIPNAAYIITDVRHLVHNCYQGSFYHICPQATYLIIFFFIYASIGWVSLVLLLNQMKKNICLIFGDVYSKFYIWIMIPLISLGVLLGLLQRWNSWQFIYKPFSICADAWLYFSDFIYFRNWLIFTVGLYVLYFAGNKLFKK